MDNIDTGPKLVSVRSSGPRSVLIYDVPDGVVLEYWSEDYCFVTEQYSHLDRKNLNAKIRRFIHGADEE